VLGIAVGTASFVAPMYISEHAPARLRGGMTAFNQFMITLGILVAYLADYALSGFSHNWRWMLGFGAVPGICLAVAMAFVPHTPRWLVQRALSTWSAPSSHCCCSTRWASAADDRRNYRQRAHAHRARLVLSHEQRLPAR
jgi:MFS family permease